MQLLVDIVDEGPAHDLIAVGAELPDRHLDLLIILIDISDDLLHEILHGNHTADSAVLVHYYGHLTLIFLHSLEHGVRLHVLIDEVSRLNQAADIDVIEAAFLLGPDGKVLHAYDSDNVVNIVIINRNAAVP